MKVLLLNSTMMPNPNGTYISKEISAEELGIHVRMAINEETEEVFESYIGYEETADLLSQLCKTPISVCREQAEVGNNDVMLVAKLKSRVKSSDKGEIKPTIDDFEFRKVLFEGDEVSNEDSEVFTFEFHETADSRKAKPYVALLTEIDVKMGFKRKFFDFDRAWGKKEITVYGNYEAKNGDVLEIQTGGSWKNTYRNFFIVYNGELVELGHYLDTNLIVKVRKYLKGELDITEFKAIERRIESEK